MRDCEGDGGHQYTRGWDGDGEDEIATGPLDNLTIICWKTVPVVEICPGVCVSLFGAVAAIVLG